MTIRLISLDNHFLIHEGIRSLIAACDQIELVATGTTYTELLPLVAQYQPDIVLLELDLPNQRQHFRAFPAIMGLHKNHPTTRVVILSRHLNTALAQGALKAGAKGYVLKSDQITNELITVIQTVYEGGIYLSEPVQNCLMNSGSVKEIDSIELTERQTEVLLTVAENSGDMQKEHARTLMISENTLKQHLREIYRALGVGNLAEAIVKGLQLQIIPFTLVRPDTEIPPPQTLVGIKSKIFCGIETKSSGVSTPTCGFTLGRTDTRRAY